MSEQVDDVALSRALKQGTQKALDGWEFTPAMSARVLDRIRADEAGVSAPVGRPDRRFKPAPVLRPLAWVAVAAAATILVINTGIPFGGSGKKQDTTSTATVESAASPQKPGEADLASGSQGTGSAPEPKTVAPNTTTGPDDVNRTTQLDSAKPRTPAPITLVDPPANASQPAAATKKSTDGLMGVAAVPHSNEAMAGTDRSWVMLQGDHVVGLSDSAETLWSRPIEHLGPDSVLAVGRDGRTAVGTAAGQISILGTNGAVERTIKATGPIRKLVWSEDGRLAALEGQRLHVYGTVGDRPEFSVDADPKSDIAFSPDGTLALFGDQKDDPGRLQLVDRTGHVILKASSERGARGLAWVAGGGIVVAGGQAFDLTGKVLWTAPIKADGTMRLGESMVLFWDAHSVVTLDALDGHVVWQADDKAAGEGVRRVVASPDGRRVAVLAATGEGQGALWVLDSAGIVKYSEHLAEMPLDLTWAAGKVMLMFPQAVAVKALP